MSLLNQYREKHPEYKSVADGVLLKALYDKHYSDKMSFDDFRKKAVSSGDAQQPRGVSVGGDDSPDGDSQVPDSQTNTQTLPQGSAFDRYIEPVKTIASSAAAQSYGGLMGLTNLLMNGDLGEANRVLQMASSENTYTPKTQEGMQGLQDFAYNVEPITRAMDDNAKRAGNYWLGKTEGMPSSVRAGIATTAHMAPDILSIAAGLHGLPATRQGVNKGTQLAVRNTARAMEPVTKPMGEVGRRMLPVQGQKKQMIAQKLQDGQLDANTAGYDLVPQPETTIGKLVNRGQPPRVTSNPIEISAQKAGWNSDALAFQKDASLADIGLMKQMLAIQRRGMENAGARIDARPADVLGDVVLGFVKSVKTANRRSGAKIDKAANGLKGQKIDVGDIGREFQAALESAGVQFKPNGRGGVRLDYTGSNYDEMAGVQNTINRIIKQIDNRDMTDAFAIHQLKRMIDDGIQYGKGYEGITGSAQQAIMDFRRGLDAKLDGKFPEYDAANTEYAATINALKEIEHAAGSGINLTSPGANSSLGQIARRITSNAVSRQKVANAYKQIQEVAEKYSANGQPLLPGHGNGRNDIRQLMVFANELEKQFGSIADTSLLGQMGSGIRLAMDAYQASLGNPMAAAEAVSTAGKFFGRNKTPNAEQLLKSMDDLLNSRLNRGR